MLPWLQAPAPYHRPSLHFVHGEKAGKKTQADRGFASREEEGVFPAPGLGGWQGQSKWSFCSGADEVLPNIHFTTYPRGRKRGRNFLGLNIYPGNHLTPSTGNTVALRATG